MNVYDKNGWNRWGTERKNIYKRPITITYKDSYKEKTGIKYRTGINLAYISAEDVYFYDPEEPKKLHRSKRTVIEKIQEEWR